MAQELRKVLLMDRRKKRRFSTMQETTVVPRRFKLTIATTEIKLKHAVQDNMTSIQGCLALHIVA